MVLQNTSFLERHYSVYNMDDNELSNWLDKWFQGDKILDKKTGVISRDVIWTVKKVDEYTSRRLYNKEYNSVSISILSSYKKDTPHSLKAQIHSIDDSSYGIWFHDLSLAEYYAIRDKIADWVDWFDTINGDFFIEYCESIGGVDVDYD